MQLPFTHPTGRRNPHSESVFWLAALLITITSIVWASAQTIASTADPATAASATSAGSDSISALQAQNPALTVVDRGQDFAVLRAVKPSATTGAPQPIGNPITLLERNLHYSQNGSWVPSQDVIEPFPDGAIAQRVSPDTSLGAQGYAWFLAKDRPGASRLEIRDSHYNLARRQITIIRRGIAAKSLSRWIQGK